MGKVYAKLRPAWPVVGLQGQRLGTVERCAIDVSAGVVTHLELKTAWQTIDIEWPGLEFDEDDKVIRLVPRIPANKD
jgi:hypothetical protein